MMRKPIFASAMGRAAASMARFRDDEGGSMALIIIFTFLIMILFGGIAIDVMRFETRRVAMQQTLDRAALAAAALPDNFATARTPQVIANDWFNKVGLGKGLFMVEYSAPTVTAISVPGKREVTISASVRSHNFFMGIFSPRDYLEGPTSTQAAQGVSNIEVMLVLDVTGSMNNSIDGKTKLASLKEAANSFVDIIESNDKKNGVSIGVVPYAAQVNVPLNLRQQFNETRVSAWDGVLGAGITDINCLEFPVSSYTSTGFSLATEVQMAASADTLSPTTTNGTYVAPQGQDPNGGLQGAVTCRKTPENGSTPWVDAGVNHVMLPTKDGAKVKQKIDRLVGYGNTYIAVGMRWGTVLMDDDARPIYTSLLASEAGMAGRPADNGSEQTRKIIILMTDGEHVDANHIRDNYKTGLSPIWRGEDGRFAIRFDNPNSPAVPIRPGSGNNSALTPTCSGWTLNNYANRVFFVPHLKRNTVNQRNGANPEGAGTGAPIANACDPQSWIAPNASGRPVWSTSGVARRLDWSEVWRYVRVSWAVQQLFVRSGVTGFTNAGTLNSQIFGTYLSNVPNMNSLLQDNCAAARAAGFEIYGIAFASGPEGAAQINGCASEPKVTYFYNAENNGDILKAFNQIATDISELRLTQ